MKKLLLLATLLLLLPFALDLSPLMARAAGKRYFENKDNYDAYVAGNGKIHVKVLIFAEGSPNYNAGRGSNHNLGNAPDPQKHATGSRIYTQRKSDGDATIQLYYWADNFYNRSASSGSSGYPKDKGCVWIQLWGGVVECTNTYDGIKQTIVADPTQVIKIDVKRKNEGDHPTWFEFDYYPPEDLDDVEFDLHACSDHHAYNSSSFEWIDHNLGTFTGASDQTSPSITEPFIYAANENGVAGYGKLATVYSTVSDVKAYYTTQDATQRVITEQTGMLYINPADTVQRGFRARFDEKRTSDGTWRWEWSNRVDVPAFHKIYDFKQGPYKYYREDLDKWYADYRYKKLSWQIKYPEETDVMEGDVFEIQRAYNADFSDAQSIDVVTMEYDSLMTDVTTNFQTYEYVDSTEAAWWNPVENSYRIYYRIRRASTAIWGWQDSNPFACTVTADVDNDHAYTIQEFNTPSTATMAGDNYYEKAEDYDTSCRVRLTFSLRSGMYGNYTEDNPGYRNCYVDANQRLILRKIMVEKNDTTLIEIPRDSIQKAINAAMFSSDAEDYGGYTPIEIHYTDHAYTPCMHYKYETYMEAKDVTVKSFNGQDDYILPVRQMRGPEIYYTDAANINTFTGSDKEYPDCVLLQWEPTEGSLGTYAIDARPNSRSEWQNLVTGITDNWYRDTKADPTKADPWQYRLTMTYTCNGTTTTRSAETTGRRNPYGKVSGRVAYEDGTGCANIEVNASRVSDGKVLQRVMTDENGNYLLDLLPYTGNAQYAITPVSQTAEFRYNNTSATFATITLTLDHCVVTAIDFENTSSVRVSGRVLYSNSTIPVRDANFLVNGKLVKVSGHEYKTDASGNFEFSVPKGAAFTLQAVKDGHWFAGDGFVSMDGSTQLTLSKPLDGVRIYDDTKVRLIGRLAGGDKQGEKPLGHGLSTNYLGDDLKMVFELEGDNISHIVDFKDDELKDTLWQQVDGTRTLFEKKRITIQPDVETGEYAVDLFPVRYKITQATAKGYATLFGDGKTSETLDLTNGPTSHKESVVDNKTVHYNADYSIIYHSPIDITCKQLRYNLEVDYYGEMKMQRTTIENEKVDVPLAVKNEKGGYDYLFGAPVFDMKEYRFNVTAHEDYYYNNDVLSPKHEEVRIEGGTLKVYNGLQGGSHTDIATYELKDGMAEIKVAVDNVSFLLQGEDALRVLDLSVAYKGKYVEKQAIRAFVTGNKKKGRDFVASTHGHIALLDILRDPPGAKSFAFIEEGTTYRYNYSLRLDFKFGVSLNFVLGRGSKISMGVFTGTGAGTYAGYLNDFSQTVPFSLPITSRYLYSNTGSYTFSTTNRIETNTTAYPNKQDADVYIGAVQNLFFGTTDAVKPIDSLTYATLQRRDANGTMKTVSSGRDEQGNLWYLVTGEETEVGSYISSTFVYTHAYIEYNLLPTLKQQRDALIYTGDSATVHSIANTLGKPVYWSKVDANDRENFGSDGYYRMLIPVGKEGKEYIDEVDAYNRQMSQWYMLLVRNETDKVNAIYGGKHQKVGTWSVSYSTSFTHTEVYDYGSTYTDQIEYPGVKLKPGAVTMQGIHNVFGNGVAQKMEADWDKMLGNGTADDPAQTPQDIKNEAAGWHLSFSFTPILDFNYDYTPQAGTSRNKKAGFVLKSDEAGYQTVSVYRVVSPTNDFNVSAGDVIDLIKDNTTSYNLNDQMPDSLYGSYVYFLEGGASRAPYEDEVRTKYYDPAVVLSNRTLKIENQKIELDVHEISNVPIDQPAVFKITMQNESEYNYLPEPFPLVFLLKEKESSNKHGARLLVDGQPLSEEGRNVKLGPGAVVTKTLQVYAGEGYDFEDLTLILASPGDYLNHPECSFSVHFTPVSSPVNITTPHDKWIMNTVSPQDSAGWYLPVSIDGFDVNYKGFDHIEFQYKLSTQSDDAWVNLCSYYYSDSLYQAASGNKAMITSGRIDNIRFYGERDPMEQQYDLRAVSFCRYGSGFITRSSAVLSGIKDTRPPRVFGQPEPANAILGVGDNLVLRFNEPIAGNYLDEDNNFQLMGVTNETGITTGASLVFDASVAASAETKARRSLENSFSIDLMVKPAATDQAEVFFTHGEGNDLLRFGKTSDNRLLLSVGSNATFYSKALDAPMTDFTRAVVTYNKEEGTVRFYAGTKEITDRATAAAFEHTIVAPLSFGSGLNGNMLEARVWTKALTPAEIANTHMKYLTGYERELLAYYPMNDGEGETVADKANGATLYTQGTAWTFEKGISLHLAATESVELAGDLMSRSSIQDETLMFWFKTASQEGTLFSAASNFQLALENGNLVMMNENKKTTVNNRPCNDGGWHHVVLTADRTHNNVSLFLDNEMVETLSAVDFASISGRMLLGGDGFEGNIDELAIFEQALPKTYVEDYAHISPYGDEMGLMAYLPFQVMKENANGILELVFSVNDQRQFKTSSGTVVNKVVPLVLADATTLTADKANYAPVRSQGQLTKLNFDWSFNGDELMINLNMQDKEINKQNIYITVRDVEDLNGNPMASPVTWTAYVDHNSLKWEDDDLELSATYGENVGGTAYRDVQIINKSGKRHQYTIESLPDWLTVDQSYGSIDPTKDKTVRISYNINLPVGKYTDVVYLTDEDGLSEPLEVTLTVDAKQPYDKVDEYKYPLNMSLCGQVKIGDVYDTDANDIVYALYRSECVGMANVAFNEQTNVSELFLTIHGNEEITGKQLNFQLWQASTGTIYDLTPSKTVTFSHGAVYGAGNEAPVLFTTSGSETHPIDIKQGWTWISSYMKVGTPVANLHAQRPWTEGDIIKNPDNMEFSTYSEEMGEFIGTLTGWDYTQMYMVYSASANTLQLNGDRLSETEKKLTLRGDGQWNSFPCLFEQATKLAEALTDYYQNATPGDIIKAQNRFAVFSADKRWVGDLVALRPGEGYLFRRMGAGDVTIQFFNNTANASARRASLDETESQQNGMTARSANNMTMIATVEGEGLRAYIGKELVGVATPIVRNNETLYFLTISSDATGMIRFETADGTPLAAETGINYVSNTHRGTLETPVNLRPYDSRTYKVIENKRVVIIRNGDKYDVTGNKIQ